MKKIASICIVLLLMVVSTLGSVVSAGESPVGVTYQGLVKGIGWQAAVSDGQVAGTQGQSLRMEALKVALVGAPEGASIKYQAHVAMVGWQNAVSNGQTAGTVGRSLQMEAVKISLENMPGYTVRYQVHVAQIGWMPWVSDGQVAGTTGRGLRLEAIRIVIEKIAVDTTVGARYQSHIRNRGWLTAVANGQTAGTAGSGLRMEAIKIDLFNAPVSILTKTPPTQTVYSVGEELDMSGMVVTVTYADTTELDVAFEDFGTYGITTHQEHYDGDGNLVSITDLNQGDILGADVTEISIMVDGNGTYQPIYVGGLEKPTVLDEVEATSLDVGQSLEFSLLSGTFQDGTEVTVDGILSWTEPWTVVDASGDFSWVFTPTDLVAYTPVYGTVRVSVVA